MLTCPAPVAAAPALLAETDAIPRFPDGSSARRRRSNDTVIKHWEGGAAIPWPGHVECAGDVGRNLRCLIAVRVGKATEIAFKDDPSAHCGREVKRH